MDSKIFVILFLFVNTDCSVINKKDSFGLVMRGLTEYLNTGKKPTYLEQAAQNYQLPNLFRANVDLESFNNAEVCYLCEVLANALILERRLGMSDTQLYEEAYYFCKLFGIENERVCKGVLDLNIEIFTYIIDNNENSHGEKVCGLLLQEMECRKGNNYEWTIEVPKGEKVAEIKTNTNSSFNILHISDIHYDPYYTPGKTNKCGEPLCCQYDQDNAAGDGDTCGYWADYTDADMPLYTIYKTMDQVNTHDFDYVYYTGDIISHRVWSTTIETNKRDITLIFDMFRKYFNVPVYPVVGNHEAHPVNLFSSEGETNDAISTQWLYEFLAEQWGSWITEEAKKTILRGGYYTISPKSGFRIIALNTNVCYTVNWWLLNDDKDPYGQLAWLADTLLKAEKNGERVHILMHVPTGNSECLRVWSREYNRIVQRFFNTIAAQFNGHTHRDELLVFYDDSESRKPINIAWNGASVTTFSLCNPSYKLHQIQDETFKVLDFEEWTFNVTLANLDPNPDKQLEWYKLYSFKNAYGVNSLDPADVNNLVHRMAKDHGLIEKYYNFKFRNSDYVAKTPCGEACQKDLLCDMTTPVHGDNRLCEELVTIYDQNK